MTESKDLLNATIATTTGGETPPLQSVQVPGCPLLHHHHLPGLDKLPRTQSVEIHTTWVVSTVPADLVDARLLGLVHKSLNQPSSDVVDGEHDLSGSWQRI